MNIKLSPARIAIALVGLLWISGACSSPCAADSDWLEGFESSGVERNVNTGSETPASYQEQARADIGSTMAANEMQVNMLPEARVMENFVMPHESVMAVSSALPNVQVPGEGGGSSGGGGKGHLPGH